MANEKCPKCLANLVPGFAFCDQCGAGLKDCPTCHRVGHKARCPEDGVTLVPRSRRQAGPAAAATSLVTPAPSSGHICLRQVDGALMLVVDSDKTVGRKEGDFMHLLAPHTQISRAHARISRAPDGTWVVEDLGSSNKTFVNDNVLEPRQPAGLAVGMRVRFADLSFVVESTRG